MLFTSDNGPWLMQGKNGGTAGPLHGGKATTWEGGMREPTIAWRPGRIAAGTVCDAVMSEMDVLPTLVKLAGGDVPADRKIDGQDVWPLLGRPKQRVAAQGFVLFQRQSIGGRPVGAVETRHHSARHGLAARRCPTRKAHRSALYSLDSDIGELADIAAEHADIVARLQALIGQMDADLGVSGIGPGVRAPDRVEKPQPLLKRMGAGIRLAGMHGPQAKMNPEIWKSLIDSVGRATRGPG